MLLIIKFPPGCQTWWKAADEDSSQIFPPWPDLSFGLSLPPPSAVSPQSLSSLSRNSSSNSPSLPPRNAEKKKKEKKKNHKGRQLHSNPTLWDRGTTRCWDGRRGGKSLPTQMKPCVCVRCVMRARGATLKTRGPRWCQRLRRRRRCRAAPLRRFKSSSAPLLPLLSSLFSSSCLDCIHGE